MSGTATRNDDGTTTITVDDPGERFHLIDMRGAFNRSQWAILDQVECSPEGGFELEVFETKQDAETVFASLTQ
jgi:hypothetical protein